MGTVLVHTSLRARDADMDKNPYLGGCPASLWMVFFLIGATRTYGLYGLSHLLSETSGKCFQHTCNGVTSHFCQYFHLFRLVHSWAHLCLWLHMLSCSDG